MMARDLKYEDKKLSLVELIQSRRFPEVVRICDSGNDDPDRIGCRYYSRIEPDTEVMLQKIQVVKYARIKVLTYYDNDKVQKEKGAEYVLEHETYVGEEFFIPLKYRGKVRFAHRPGSWRRYATVSQVLENLPSSIKVGEDTECSAANDLNKKIRIPAHTVLELKRKFQNPEDGCTYLECSDKKTSYAVQVGDRINCTEVDDPKLYNLFELTRCKMLPKVILFEKVPLEDGILVDMQLNSAMLSSTEGPLELLGFADVKVLVSWIRDKEKKVFRTVLIPEGGWNSMLVQRRIFPEYENKEMYIERKYPLCHDSDFIEKYMYFMSLDQSFVTWIRNPDFYTSPGNDNEMYGRVPIKFPESSDDEDTYASIFEQPEEPPPLPPHIRLPGSVGASKDNNVWKTKMRLKEKIFQKVHKELLHFFHKHKSSSFVEPSENAPARPPKPPLLRSISERNDRSNVKALKQRFQSNSRTQQQEENVKQHFRPRSSSMDDTYITRGELDIPEEDEGDLKPHDYDYPDIDKVTDAYRESLDRKAHANADRPLPPIPIEIPAEIKNTKEKPKYVSLKMEDAEHLFNKNLGAADFFTYTVVEVEHVFKYCGLPEFANICLEQRLDGKFFENYDLQDLKKEPFLMSEFHILKVKKMIFNGWRPNVCNDSGST